MKIYEGYNANSTDCPCVVDCSGLCLCQEFCSNQCGSQEKSYCTLNGNHTLAYLW